MLQIKFEPQEIEFLIAASNTTQIMGKDAHAVSKILKKLEDKLANFKPVQG